MNLTKKEAIELHRKMWNWIADETEKQQGPVTKEMYFKLHPELGIPNYLCYCCDYDDHQHYSDCVCKHCPIIWEGVDKKVLSLCNDRNSIYYKWYKLSSDYHADYHVIANLARQIANLPEKED